MSFWRAPDKVHGRIVSIVEGEGALWDAVAHNGEVIVLSARSTIAGIFDRHAKTVYRLCYSYLGSAPDAEDAVQAVFAKLVASPREFEDAGHEKAWLTVCASNHCKDVLKSAHRSRAADMPADVVDERASAEPNPVLQAVLALPEIYKDCVYLHYYEGYKTDEIAQMLDTPPSTIRNRLRDARALLKETLGGNHDR